jgi:quercetin dioxygenase-like cupin family protein
MTQDEFAKNLESEGFDEIATVMRDANGSLDDHTHPFEAKALVLDGELRITTAHDDRTYRAGDVFHLKANELHSEVYGPLGVAYIVGRKGK